KRGGWALFHLARARAVERPVRGHYRITDIGRRLLASHPDGITEGHLNAVGGDPTTHQTAMSGSPPMMQPGHVPTDEESALDPEEQIASGVARINDDVSAELLNRIMAQEPVFFEQAVLDLLIAMGYGGTEGRATRTRLSNDGGIDGVVDQDALGLSRIYVQAKRYAAHNSVGRPAIQEFVGALTGKQANQGVFITTSTFTSDAATFAEGVSTRVVLIDGYRLARLMIRYGVGVQVKQTIQIVDIDEDYFE
ncbi:MAG: restriction endonuclease, partial [Dermatophilaceae bacterium]